MARAQLDWREVSEVLLREPLVPDPNQLSVLLERLNGVRVAVEDGFLHIDPHSHSENPPAQPCSVTIVPGTSVVSVAYQAPDYREQPKFSRDWHGSQQ